MYVCMYVWIYVCIYIYTNGSNFVENNSSKQTLIMTDKAVLLACRTSIAVLITPGESANHVASLEFYKQITANTVHIQLSHCYKPAAIKFRTFLNVVPFAAN